MEERRVRKGKGIEFEGVKEEEEEVVRGGGKLRGPASGQ